MWTRMGKRSANVDVREIRHAPNTANGTIDLEIGRVVSVSLEELPFLFQLSFSFFFLQGSTHSHMGSFVPEFRHSNLPVTLRYKGSDFRLSGFIYEPANFTSIVTIKIFITMSSTWYFKMK